MHPSQALDRHQTKRPTIRSAAGPAEARFLVAEDAFRLLQPSLPAPPEEEHLLLLDEVISGHLQLGSGTASEVIGQARDEGSWALSGRLMVCPRLLLPGNQRGLLRLLHLAGPVSATLFAHRYGLKGYVAAVVLTGFDAQRPRFSLQAYAQQVAATSIFEPLLSVYLKAGAQLVDVVETSALPLALVRRRL